MLMTQENMGVDISSVATPFLSLRTQKDTSAKTVHITNEVKSGGLKK